MTREEVARILRADDVEWNAVEIIDKHFGKVEG